MIGLGLIIFIAVACAPQTRYRVLSFFFDGVPNGKEVKRAPTGSSRQFTSFNMPAPQFTPRPTPPPIVSIHKPYMERKCGACHEINGNLQPFSTTTELCDRCHGKVRRQKGWNHGPINLGMCIYPCHDPHDSTFPHLLNKPVPELCLVCHQEDMDRNGKEHQVPNRKDCTACHDPHVKG